MKKLLVPLILLGLVATVFVRGMASGWFGEHEEPGEVTKIAIPGKVIRGRETAQRNAATAVGQLGAKQILFGDLHVHTTFSTDAFLTSLPLLGGEGAHPPADACDYARFCSALDFWSINDHAEGITPQHWSETIESIRQCNDVSGDPSNPDVVAFLGWEWTQVGQTPETHYGHKNVVLRGLEDEEITARPIGSRGLTQQAMRQGLPTLQAAAIGTFGGDSRYNDLLYYMNERAETDACPDGVPSRSLPADCLETTTTPGELFEKLGEWDVDSIVIPHGTAWGMYSPAGSSWDKQLTAEQHDPERQKLVEVFSGHGNSEEYRDFRAVRFDDEGNPYCPQPTDDYLPSCWRAGEIIRQRCMAQELGADECDARAAEARKNYLAAGISGHLTVPGATIYDWLDSGQCQDCFLPAFNLRPRNSVQYMMALRNFSDDGGPDRFRFGFMASSDNHTARPGTGFKEIDRRENTEAAGPSDEDGESLVNPPSSPPLARSLSPDELSDAAIAFQRMEMERQASFFLTGGLIATHADGRDRQAVWDAFQRREVYGTSGDRILLWFDLVDEKGRTVIPMGGEVEMFQTPRFRARAVGAFKQKPGCPEHATGSLDMQRLEHLCRGECYNPSDERKRITRVEVVRIRPQSHEGESVSGLIDDPWKVFTCEPNPEGCVVEFEDPQFAGSNRHALYYVRAIQEPTSAVNADSLRCERDAQGDCLEVDPCFGDYRTDYEDDCLAENEERAWSSPIFIDHVRARDGA